MRISELNKDQLDNLAKLCFDIAKGLFLVAFAPFIVQFANVNFQIITVSSAMILGLVFTYGGLVLLKLKEKAL